MEVVASIFRVWAVQDGTLLQLLGPWRWRHQHVAIYQSTRRHILQDVYLHQHRCENLKPPVITCIRNGTLIHKRVWPEAVQFRVTLYTLIANICNASNRQFRQMVPMCLCTYVPMYSLHVLCTGWLWLALSWTAPVQLCVRPLGSICWVVRPSLERKKGEWIWRLKWEKQTRKTRTNKRREW